MFLKPIEFIREGNKTELFKWCFNRCVPAFDVAYEYVEASTCTFWTLDDRFYEQDIEILYERFCYAMGIITERFAHQCHELSGEVDTQRKSLTFAICLSSTLRIFSRLLQTPVQKIAASAMMRTACSMGAAVRPKGPNGAHRSFQSDQ